MRNVVWFLFALVAGASSASILLLYRPDLYIGISDTLSWRLSMPPVGQTRLETTLRTIHMRADALVNGDATVLLGDSHLHGLPGSVLGRPVVNYAIAGETADQMAIRVGLYGSLARARRVILLSGRNDLARGQTPAQVAQSITRTLDRIPTTTPISLVAIPALGTPPINGDPAAEANRLLEQICSARSQCRFIDTRPLADATGALRAEYCAADGIHLTSKGYAKLSSLILAGIQESPTISAADGSR